MSDTDTTDEMTERQPAERAPDGFAVFEQMLKLIADPQSFAKRMGELKRSIEAVADGEAKLAVDRAAFQEHERTVRAELQTERAAVDKRKLAVQAAEGMLSEREARIAALEKAWHNIGEPDDVRRGFQDPAVPALEKARRAHGIGRMGFDGGSFPQGTSLTRDDPPAGPYVERDKNKLPMVKPPAPRGRGRRGVRVALA
jgi:hypothetical protein